MVELPTGFVARGGMSLKQVSVPQQQAAMKLMGTVLSPMGLEKVDEIWEADDDFKALGSKRGPGGGAGASEGTTAGWTGRISATVRQARPGRAWGWSTGRRYVRCRSVLHLIPWKAFRDPTVDAPIRRAASCPEHHDCGQPGRVDPHAAGAQPALFKLNGKTIRPVGRESDKALALLKALDESQSKQAVLSYQVADLVHGPGQDGKKIAPEGMKASKMNAQQQTMLQDVIAEWSGILTEPYAATRMNQMKADLNQTYFAWSGPTNAEVGTNITAYYRIQGGAASRH